MPDTTAASRRVLTPIERFSEVLFGIIMVLTFTCSLSVAESGREDVRTMLLAALGCNLAWGIIDALLYFVNTVAERGRGLVVLRRVRSTPDAAEARRLIAEALPPVIAERLEPRELDALRERLVRDCVTPARIPMSGDDLRGALGVFLLVFLSTFPIALPFLAVHDAFLAMRLSNGVAVALLFVVSANLARYIGVRPWLLGVCMVLLGGGLVALTIALGG